MTTALPPRAAATEVPAGRAPGEGRSATAGWPWIGADAPRPGSSALPWPAYALAAGLVVLVTVVDAFLVGRTSESNLIMAYLLAALPVALRGDVGAAITAAVLSVLAFDFFFVPPYLTFAVSDFQYVFTFLVMGIVGGAIAALTAQLAAELADARRRERGLRALHALSQSLLAAREPGELVTEGARVLGDAIGLPVAGWLRDAAGEPVPATAAAAPLPLTVAETLRGVVRQGRASGPGTSRLPGAAWLIVPIRTEERVHGALGLALPPGDAAAAPTIRAALETGANQIAVALEQARAREATEAARRQAEAERLRSALLSAISHDLRTPLTGIVGAAGALAEGAESLPAPTRRELAQGIAEEGARLGRLMTNLLEATRLEGGPPRLERSWYPLEELVGPALAALEGPLAGRRVEVSLPPELPLVWVDATLVGRTITNLLENAAKHTPAGTPVYVRATGANDQVFVEIADAGPGLPPGEEGHVFERFRRGPGARDGGVGLGLAIAKGAIEAHGGTIEAGRAPEGGACFRFTLPAPPPPGGPPEIAP